MSGPVTVVQSGGFPVLPVDRDAPVIEAVKEGGTPVTITPHGTPFILTGYSPDYPMGPMDYATHELGGFTGFSRNYQLASDTAVLGLVCHCTGSPVLEIKHGGEPLTIIEQHISPTGVLSLIAAGTGLTVEEAPLTISVTGGELNGGALRINEMMSPSTPLSGWSDGAAGSGRPVETLPVSGTSGGVIKLAYGTNMHDPHFQYGPQGVDIVWAGNLVTGPLVGVDVGPSGPWELSGGWAWDGNDLVHTGSAMDDASILYQKAAGGVYGPEAYAIIGDSATLRVSPFAGSYTSYSGPRDSWVNGTATGSAGNTVRFGFQASGNVRLSNIRVVEGGYTVGWRFGSTPAVDGDSIVTTIYYQPNWSISAAEIRAGDY